jgi:hypothetical protein
MVNWHVINFNLNRLGNMGALIWIAIAIVILLVIWLNRKSKGDRATMRHRQRDVKQPTSSSQNSEVSDVSSLEYPDMDNAIDRDIQKQERERIEQAEYLIQQAKLAIGRDTSNPFDKIELLATAIEFYEKSYLLVNRDSCLQAIEGIQLEIDRRHQFQSLFRDATASFYHKQFGKALTTLFSAQELYSPQQLIKTIADCEEQAKAEKIYLQSLAEAKMLSYAGKFRDAMIVVDRALIKFSRQDGEDLKIRLNRVVAAKEQLNLAKIEQNIGNSISAKYHYSAALHLIPDWKEPKLQLAIIEAQSEEKSNAISLLATIDDPETKCLEGLVYLKNGQPDRAREIWSNLDLDLVRKYCKLVSISEIEECKLAQTQIKQLVDRGELEQSRTVSLEFIDRFGSDSIIETNLTNCILPGIEAKIWKSEDWQNIAILTRENWSSQPNIKSLHNWTIALYYATQIDDRIEELIVAWATAIANIDLDPTLQDLPWLKTKSQSTTDLSSKLWQLLEQRIEAIKESDPARYLHLRDRYRQEFWAMELARLQPNAKIIVGELMILPGCYQRYYSQISLGEIPQLWKTLYTDWGKAVAACLAGDPQRAAIIKTDLVVDSSLAELADRFILYQQGCYYLQQEDWHSAIYPLNDAKTTIHHDREWWNRIDELCQAQRRKIMNFEEHLSFAQFWYDLLSSHQSEDYLIEHRALKIQQDWANSIVTDELSLTKIKDLQDTYPQHLVVKEVCTQIETYCLSNQ